MRIVILSALALSLCAQTQVYLKDGPPSHPMPGAQICGNSGAGSSPMTVNTCAVNTVTAGAHNFPAGCGTTQTCWAVINNLVSDLGAGNCPNGSSTGTAGAQNVDKILTVSYQNATTLALYDTTGVPANGSGPHLGNPIPSNGSFCSGEIPGQPPNMSMISLLSPYTLSTSAQGWLDGPTGNLTRHLSLGPLNGLTSLLVTGSGAITITVTTSYDPTAVPNPVAVGNPFSILGTGTILDSTNPSSCAGGGGTWAVPIHYTMATVSPTGWTATATCGLPAGDYTNKQTFCGPASPTPNDTWGHGTQSCTRVSQDAYDANLQWYNLMTGGGGNVSQYYTNSLSANGVPAWYSTLDGGNVQGWQAGWNGAAIGFLADPSNQFAFNVVQYVYQYPEKSAGPSWYLDELPGQGNGNQYCGTTACWVYESDIGFGVVELAYGAYASTATQITNANKLNNTITDPNNVCTKTGVELGSSTPTSNYVVSSGTSIGAPGATSMQLANNATAGVNELLTIDVTGESYPNTPTNPGGYALITSVSGCTGSGACTVTYTGGWTFNPSWATLPAGPTTYQVFATLTLSTVASGAKAAVTLYGATAGQLGLQVGDAITGANGYYSLSQGAVNLCGVATLSPLTCYAGGYQSSTLTTVPQLAWHVPQLSVSSTSTTSSVGMCGMKWAFDHTFGWNAQPATFPQYGGTLVGSSLSTYWTANQPGSYHSHAMALDLAQIATGTSDSRNTLDLARRQQFMADWWLGNNMTNYAQGLSTQGGHYGFWEVVQNATYAWLMQQNFPSFPSMNSGNQSWADMGPWPMYGTLPDFNPAPSDSYGAPTGLTICILSGCGEGYSPIDGMDQNSSYYPQVYLSPGTPYTKYYLDFIQHAFGSTLADQSGNYKLLQIILSQFAGSNNSGLDWRQQPPQFLFHNTTGSLAQQLTGWGQPQNAPGQSVLALVSRTSLSNYRGAGAGGTVVADSCMAFTSGYQNFGCDFRIYKYGPLIADDYVDSGNISPDWWQGNNSYYGPATLFGGYAGVNTQFLPQAITTNMKNSTVSLVRWASANRGTWPSNYGDQAGTYSHLCRDSAGLYAAAWGVTSQYKCVSDFKKSSGDQFIVEHEYSSSNLSGGVAIQKSEHYPQGADAGACCWEADVPYKTGQTICTDLSGNQVACSNSLNIYRRIQSTECSGTGCPPAAYGVVSQIYSPSTITVTWDTPGGSTTPPAQASPTNTYSGGYGYSNRVTIAGGSSVGARVSSLEYVVVHKIMSSITDTTLNSRSLNPNANWTGVEACGANSGIAQVGTRGSSTFSSAPSFALATSDAGGNTSACAQMPYQILISGLTPGTYTVTLAGTPLTSCSGATGTTVPVSAGDNSVECNVASVGAGSVVTLSQAGTTGAAAASSISGQVNPSGNVVIR